MMLVYMLEQGDTEDMVKKGNTEDMVKKGNTEDMLMKGDTDMLKKGDMENVLKKADIKYGKRGSDGPITSRLKSAFKVSTIRYHRSTVQAKKRKKIVTFYQHFLNKNAFLLVRAFLENTPSKQNSLLSQCASSGRGESFLFPPSWLPSTCFAWTVSEFA